MATLGKLKYADRCVFSFYPPFMCTIHCLYMATTSVRSQIYDFCAGDAIIKRVQTIQLDIINLAL